MSETFTFKDNKHRFWHKMEKVAKDQHLLWGYLAVGGGVTYYECTKCRTRRVVKDHDNYQAIDYDWLYFNSDILVLENQQI